MSDTIHFLFALHNHQPDGNFDEVFENAYNQAYLPMLEAIERHPHIRLAQHFTGILIEWFHDKHPDFLDRYSALVEQGRVEMMTGGFFEPILPSIPDRDKLGQIEALTETIRKRFKYDPIGLWLAERVYEPYLPKPLSEAGVKYVLLDDAHFKVNGLRDEELLGYFNTEEQGRVLSIFPVNERLRYTIPFQPPETTIEHLLRFSGPEEHRMMIMGDDGEKFGVWPGTHDSVYTQGWLERFFTQLEQNQDRIQMITPAEYHQRYSAIGNIYLPTASYREMMEWALAPDDSYELDRAYHDESNAHLRRFLRGGFWRNFLVKYAEANNEHKKMLWVGEKIERIPKNRKARSKALFPLWRGQCNCGYWHGVFGGLYLNFLRSAIYRSLIQAENEADRFLHKSDTWVDAEEADFLRCGSHCVILSNPDMTCCFQTDSGAMLFELDLREKEFNLLNTLSRYKEGYHKKLLEAADQGAQNPEKAVSIHDLVIMKEKGLEKRLHYDWHRRSAAIDHFFSYETTIEQFRTCAYEELGDFVNQAYSVELNKKKKRAQARFQRSGHVLQDSEPRDVHLAKTVTLQSEGRRLPVEITITNTSDRKIYACYASEWGFSMNAGDTFDRYYIVPEHTLKDKNLGSVGIVPDTTHVILVEEWIGIDVHLSWNAAADLWRFPIETVASSEGGFERSYQSSLVLPVWRLALEPQESWSVQLELEIKHR